MSERNRYRVAVTYENIVWADNADEAEDFGVEECEAGRWNVVSVDVDPAPPRDPVEEIERRINGNRTQ
jgi:hypothetical protein